MLIGNENCICFLIKMNSSGKSPTKRKNLPKTSITPMFPFLIWGHEFPWNIKVSHIYNEFIYIYIHVFVQIFNFTYMYVYCMYIFIYWHSNKLACLENGPWMQMYRCISPWKTLDVKLPCFRLPEGSNLSDCCIPPKLTCWTWGHPLKPKQTSNFETISSLGLGFVCGKNPAHLGKLYIAHP